MKSKRVIDLETDPNDKYFFDEDRVELSKEEWNERIGEVQVKINELEEKLNELRKLV